MRRIAAALAILATGACSFDPPAEWLGPDRPAAPATVVHQPEPRSVLEVPAAEMADAVREGYRTPPDRRFLTAVAWIDELLTAREPDAVEARWDGDRWVVRYRTETVGSLPDLPSMEEGLALLRGWAAGLTPGAAEPALEGRAADVVAIRAGIDDFETESVADALRGIDAAWRDGRRSAELADLAVDGLLALLLQSYDQLELADALASKALAAVVVSEAVSGRRDPVAEALVAAELGYTRHAERVAESLPDSHPVALYVRSEDERLRRAAESPDAPAAVRYMHVLRLSSTRDVDALAEWSDRYGLQPRSFGVAQLKPALSTRTFQNDAQLAPLGPYMAIYDLWKIGLPDAVEDLVDARVDEVRPSTLRAVGVSVRNSIGVPHAELARRFETDAARVAERYEGPFLDAATTHAFFSAAFYSAEWRLARHVLDGYSSVGLADELASSLERGAPEGPATELARWYRHLADAKAGSPDADALLADLDSLRFLGRVALDRTHRELVAHVHRLDPTRQTAARAFASHLDSRVANRYRIASVLRSELRDVAGAEPYYESVLRDARGADQLTMWTARYVGDVDAVVAMVRDTSISPGDRMYGWEAIRHPRFGLTESEVRGLARGVVVTAADSWSARDTYIRYLEDRGAFGEALAIVDEWLARHDRSDGFPYIFARTARARMLQHQGRYEEAWQAVEPVMTSGQAGALGRGALILEHLGHHREATVTAEGVVARYPGSAWGRSVLAEIHWRNGRNDEAGAALHAPGHPIWPQDWVSEITPAFLRVFGDASLADARSAFGALMDGGIPPWEVESLARNVVSHGGAPELAFELTSMLPTPAGSAGSLRTVIPAYRLLEEMRGTDAALAWIRERVPLPQRNVFALSAYGERAYDLLWTLVDEPERGPFPSNVWEMRAAAHTRLGGRDAPGRREALLDYYAQAPRSDPYVLMGAYLMDVVDADRLLEIADAADRRTEVAYVLAVKAGAEGRLDDAVAWYRVVVELGQPREFEHMWSVDQLDRWRNLGRRLDDAQR